MIQKLIPFGLILLLEILIVFLLWWLASSYPLVYTLGVLIISLVLFSLWRYRVFQEKQKIYDKDTLLKRRRLITAWTLKITLIVLVFVYAGFLIKVALG